MRDLPRARIDTVRLRLEPLWAEDAAALFAYRAHPDVARYQGWRPACEADAAAFIAVQSLQPFGTHGAWCQLAIRRHEEDELLGDLGVHFPPSPDDPIEFGVSLRPEWQRQGYAREVLHAAMELAFSRWGYRRAVCSVDPRNTASVALCRAMGMRLEAHHVESYRSHGTWADDMIFAILAREWPARN